MAGNREKAQKVLLKWIGKILPGSGNVELYKQSLDTMTDREFDQIIQQIEQGEFVFPLIVENMSEKKLTVDDNLALAEELGHEFFQHLYLTDPATGEVYKTPVKYLVLDLPLRRQAQTLVKGAAIPDGAKGKDQLTGQRSSSTKGSRISFPEVQLLTAMGLDNTILELIKVRGGDEKAMRLMDREIIERGGADLKYVMSHDTEVRSTKTLNAYLKAMHLDNNL